MSYTPPAGDEILINFSGSYTHPAGDEILLAFGESVPNANTNISAIASNISIGEKVCNGSVDFTSISETSFLGIKLVFYQINLISIVEITTSGIFSTYGLATLSAISSSYYLGEKVGVNATLLSATADEIIDYITIKDFEIWASSSKITRTFTEDSIFTVQYSEPSVITRVFKETSKLRN